jgi:single-strand DNA-binding protein
MFHTLILAGRLGRDPEMRYTPGGQAVTNFNVATNREYSKNEERIKETTWFRITAWGKLAETCNEYLRKGSQVLVEGRLNPDESGNPRTWEKNDGTVAASFEVTAATVRFLGGTERREDSGVEDEFGVSEDIPF